MSADSQSKPAIYLGLMSGTSLDGVDIAAVDFSDGPKHPPRTIAADTLPYDKTIGEQLKKALLQADKVDSATLANLDNELGIYYATLINTFIHQHAINKNDIAAVGSHGHTLLHQPSSKTQTGYSLQIGNPNAIAAITACTVVADFRRTDIALGGQGAPLAPAFHEAYLSSQSEQRIVANIGGIANISLMNQTGVVAGFDTGPGNTLMNAYCQKHFSQAYDNHGELAASGKVSDTLCAQLLTDVYFLQPLPKSTGPEYFNEKWLTPYLKEHTELSHADILASLCHLTARSIADACLDNQQDTARLLICGGGVHNKTLMNMLQACLPYPVHSTADYGLHPDNIEALAFAWLAKQRLNNIPANLPQVTGAKQACLLGAIYAA